MDRTVISSALRRAPGVAGAAEKRAAEPGGTRRRTCHRPPPASPAAFSLPLPSIILTRVRPLSAGTGIPRGVTVVEVCVCVGGGTAARKSRVEGGGGRGAPALRPSCGRFGGSWFAFFPPVGRFSAPVPPGEEGGINKSNSSGPAVKVITGGGEGGSGKK